MRPSVRLSVVLWLFGLLAFVTFFVSHLAAFIQIFFTHSGISLTQAEAFEAFEANKSRTAQIPKIIHQVFHNWKDPGNDTLPGDWNKVRQTCIDKNPGWTYYLWTEKASREFIEREYPWFLKTYDRYSFPVQRVDAVRYFLLLYYGGIYIDLDNGCMASLEPLTYYPMWITDGGRGALSNNVLASRPNHPFWTLLTQSLMPYNYHYFFPYATISYASGQWFETAIWEKYHALLPTADRSSMDHRLHRLMMDDREGADKWLFFTQERGGSWNHWDNYLFMMIGDHLMVFLLLLFSFIGAAGWLLVRFMRKYKKGEGYTRLRNQPDRHTV